MKKWFVLLHDSKTLLRKKLELLNIPVQSLLRELLVVTMLPNRTNLFAPYVDTWLKIKQESSGYPSWAQTDAQKEDYVKNYKAREGIDLDPQHIKKNPGRKATAKLMLNSFWGKFGEQMNKMKTKQITEPHELIDHLNDTTIEISDVRILSADVIELTYKKIEEDAVKGSKTNIFIAAFTTCQARLKLYESLEALGDRVLYYDTDSVIYTWKPCQTEIPLGDYLGDMTNELDEGDYIVEFVSGGAKNYGYATKHGKIVCKVRGFSLNVRGAKQLNYQVMRQNILDEILDPQDERRDTDIVNPRHFQRDPIAKKIKTETQVKKYGLVFDKRVLHVGTFKSYPYGYAQFTGFDAQDILNIETLI